MLSKANTSLPVPLVQDSVYKYVPLRSIENHTAASYVVNHATSELEIHSNLLQKSKRVNTFPPRILSGLLEKVITLNNLWKEWKNWSGAQMGEGGSERQVGGGGGGGEVAKCQRSHEWDIESISFMFNTHMDEESNWRCGGLFRQVTEHRRPQEKTWTERRSVCMLTLCLVACVSKQVHLPSAKLCIFVSSRPLPSLPISSQFLRFLQQYETEVYF